MSAGRGQGCEACAGLGGKHLRSKEAMLRVVGFQTGQQAADLLLGGQRRVDGDARAAWGALADIRPGGRDGFLSGCVHGLSDGLGCGDGDRRGNFRRGRFRWALKLADLPEQGGLLLPVGNQALAEAVQLGAQHHLFAQLHEAQSGQLLLDGALLLFQLLLALLEEAVLLAEVSQGGIGLCVRIGGHTITPCLSRWGRGTRPAGFQIRPGTGRGRPCTTGASRSRSCGGSRR